MSDLKNEAGRGGNRDPANSPSPQENCAESAALAAAASPPVGVYLEIRTADAIAWGLLRPCEVPSESDHAQWFVSPTSFVEVFRLGRGQSGLILGAETARVRHKEFRQFLSNLIDGEAIVTPRDRKGAL